jgi:hypothetical protein
MNDSAGGGSLRLREESDSGRGMQQESATTIAPALRKFPVPDNLASA